MMMLLLLLLLLLSVCLSLSLFSLPLSPHSLPFSLALGMVGAHSLPFLSLSWKLHSLVQMRSTPFLSCGSANLKTGPHPCCTGPPNTSGPKRGWSKKGFGARRSLLKKLLRICSERNKTSHRTKRSNLCVNSQHLTVKRKPSVLADFAFFCWLWPIFNRLWPRKRRNSWTNSGWGIFGNRDEGVPGGGFCHNSWRAWFSLRRHLFLQG